MLMYVLGLSPERASTVLEVPLRTIEAWMADERVLPPVIARQVDDLISEQQRTIAQIIDALSTMPLATRVLAVPMEGELGDLDAGQWMAVGVGVFSQLDGVRLVHVHVVHPDFLLHRERPPRET